MVFLSFSSVQKKELAIVLDIGSGSVGAAIVALEKKQYPKILYVTRENIAYYQHLGFKRFLGAMLHALETATTRLHREAFEHSNLSGIRARDVEHIHCMLASPWYTSTTKILCYEKDMPFLVTNVLVNNLVEQSLLTSQERKLHENQTNEPKTIETKIIQILLNGYETAKPYEQNASHIEVALFTSAVAQEIGSRIQSIVRKTWLNKKISFHSFALASFTVTRDLFPKNDNFMLIDVTGEVTDIFFSKNGVLVETCSTPYGKNSMLRDTARTLQTTPEEALSRLRQHISKKTTPEASLAIEAAIEAAGKQWVAYFEKILSYVLEAESIPRQVYMMADPDVGELFASWVHKENVGRKTLGSQGYSVTHLTPQVLGEHVRFVRVEEPDFFVGIESIYLAVLHALFKT